MSIRSKHVIWHRHLVLFGFVGFLDEKRSSLSLASFVLRRWSRSKGDWIYARLGTRNIGALTK